MKVILTLSNLLGCDSDVPSSHYITSDHDITARLMTSCSHPTKFDRRSRTIFKCDKGVLGQIAKNHCTRADMLAVRVVQG